MSRNRPIEKQGFAFSVAVRALIPLVKAVATRTWIGAEKLPKDSAAILAFNHISHFDPLVTGLFVYENGHVPRYLVKDSLFRVPVLRHLLQQGRQIPVARLSDGAVDAYAAAIKVLDEGKFVGIYPEGSLTRDPDLWPMRAKSGAARLALASGAPVIPIGHWGAQDVLPPYSRRPRLIPRGHVHVVVGEPVDLADLLHVEHTPEVVEEATRRIMAAIVGLVEELRGETAPEERFDPRTAGLSQIGRIRREEETKGQQR